MMIENSFLPRGRPRGLELDYSKSNQGSDLMVLTRLTRDGFIPMSESAWNLLVR